MAKKLDFTKWDHSEGSNDLGIYLSVRTDDERSTWPELAVDVKLVFRGGKEGFIKYTADMLGDNDTLHLAELALALLVKRPPKDWDLKQYPLVKQALEKICGK